MATALLKKAFDKAAEEMPEFEQDEFARWLLKTLESDDRQWEAAFARSPETLQRLADRARETFLSGPRRTSRSQEALKSFTTPEFWIAYRKCGLPVEIRPKSPTHAGELGYPFS